MWWFNNGTKYNSDQSLIHDNPIFKFLSVWLHKNDSTTFIKVNEVTKHDFFDHEMLKIMYYVTV